MMTAHETYPLLGDLSGVPDDYIRDVAHTKRFLERWTMDPAFRDRYHDDPQAAIDSLGLRLVPDQIVPLIDPDRATAVTEQLQAGNTDACPSSVLRYRAFIAEKRGHRSLSRADGEAKDRRLAAWRRRQINRCVGELGVGRAEAIVHGPMAIELAKGCTVGCWFCGVAAPKFDHTWPYTPENAELWRGLLATMHDVMGPAAQQGFLYWATDPLDNPDYEHFLRDFHTVLGRCPQTTTAIAQKDIDRTKRLLELSHSLGSSVDRFSIISLNSLDRVHAGLTPEEMLRVECVPQNREASDLHRKSNAGRARKFAHKRGAELVQNDESSTIACVSGFLFNMVDRRVKLITPCNANERWPLGYWVVADERFDSVDELREVLETVIREKCRTNLGVTDTVRLRPDVRLTVDAGVMTMSSLGMTVRFAALPDADNLAAALTEGTSTVEEIAIRRERQHGVSLVDTMALLDQVFAQGLTDEEPLAPRTVSGPLDLTLQGAR